MIIIKNRFSVNLSVHPFVKIPVYFQVLHSFLDSEALFTSGKMSLDQFMGILNAMKEDTSYIIRDEICSVIGSLSMVLKHSGKGED